MLKDKLGNEVKLGDVVAYAVSCYGGSSKLKFAVVHCIHEHSYERSQWYNEGERLKTPLITTHTSYSIDLEPISFYLSDESARWIYNTETGKSAPDTSRFAPPRRRIYRTDNVVVMHGYSKEFLAAL